MPGSIFYILFGISWLVTAAYAVSAFIMAFRLYRLKKQGRFADAPDPLHPMESLRALGWLLSGRFAELDDPVVAHWAGIARILFLTAAPLMMTVFVLGFGQARSLP